MEHYTTLVAPSTQFGERLRRACARGEEGIIRVSNGSSSSNIERLLTTIALLLTYITAWMDVSLLILKDLISRGTNPNLGDGAGSNSVHYATQFGQVGETVK